MFRSETEALAELRRWSRSWPLKHFSVEKFLHQKKRFWNGTFSKNFLSRSIHSWEKCTITWHAEWSHTSDLTHSLALSLLVRGPYYKTFILLVKLFTAGASWINATEPMAFVSINKDSGESWGRKAQWIAFSLCTQRPRVRFSAFPRNFLSENSSHDVAEIF